MSKRTLLRRIVVLVLTLLALQLTVLAAVRRSIITRDNDVWFVLPLMALGWTGLVAALVLQRLGLKRAFQLVAVVSFLMLSCQSFYFTSLSIVGESRPTLQRQ